MFWNFNNAKNLNTEIILRLILFLITIGVLAYANTLTTSFILFIFWLVPLFMLLNLASYSRLAEKLPRARSMVAFLRKASFVWYIVPTAAVISFSIGVKNMATPVENYWFLFVVWFVNVVAVAIWALGQYLPKGELSWKNFKTFIYDYRWEIAGISLLTFFAFFVRFINVAILPAPFSGDEASIAIEARFNHDLIQNVFKSGIQGHSGLYFLSLVPFHRLFEAQLAQRLLSVLIGTATIPIFYFFLRQIWGRLVAFGGAFYLAAYHFHNHFSRFGMTVIGDPFIILLGLYFTWRAIKIGKKSDFVILGLVTGLSLYFYVGARLLHLLVVFFIFFVVVTQKKYLKANASNFLLIFLAYLIVAAPIGLFWLSNQNAFMTAPNSVLIFKTGWLDQQKSWGKNMFQILTPKLKESFGVFGFVRKDGPAYDPPITLVDQFSLAFLIIGFLLSIVRFWELKNLMLITLFFATVLGGAVMTVNLSTSRLLSTTIPVTAWVVLGTVYLCSLFFRGKLLSCMVIGTLLFLVTFNLWFYFGVYSKGSYFSDWNTEVAEKTAQHILALPANTALFHFGAPSLYAGHPTSKLQFYEHGIPFFDVLEDGRVMPEKPAEPSPRIFVFLPNHRQAELMNIQERCPGGSLKNITNGENQILFISYEFSDNSSCVPN